MPVSGFVRRIAVFAVSAWALALIGATPSQAASEGFHVYNHSSTALRVSLVKGNSRLDSGPPEGAVLAPGVSDQAWEVLYDPFNNTYNEVYYKIEGANGGWLYLQLYVNKKERAATSTCNVLTTAFQPNSAFRCTADGKRITFQDPPGTKIEIGAQRHEEQLKALKQFCTRENSATCEFGSIREQRTFGPAHQVGLSIKNTLSIELQSRIETSDHVLGSNSIGLTASKQDPRAALAAFEPMEKMAKQRLTDSVVFPGTVVVKVRPHMEAWITHAPPIIRFTGEFKLTLGNTTWILRDVSFEFPDQTRAGIWEVHERPLAPS